MRTRSANSAAARKSPTRRSTRIRNITTRLSTVSVTDIATDNGGSVGADAASSSRDTGKDVSRALLAVEMRESGMMAQVLSRAVFDLENIQHLFQPHAWFLKGSLSDPSHSDPIPTSRHGTTKQSAPSLVDALATLEIAARNLSASSAALSNVFQPTTVNLPPSIAPTRPAISTPSAPKAARASPKKRKTDTISDFFDPFSIQPTPLGLHFQLAPSGFGLIQERIRNDLWALVVQAVLWNQTTARAGRPVLFKLLSMYPTPQAMAAARFEDVLGIIGRLGLQNKRSVLLINLAKSWLVAPPDPSRRYARKNYPLSGHNWNVADGTLVDKDDPRPGYEIAHLPGIGPYAIDSYRIFYRDTLLGIGSRPHEVVEPEWKRVIPLDKDLRAYLKWRWRQEGWEWDMLTGQRERILAGAP